jgi:hypothetical protein
MHIRLFWYTWLTVNLEPENKSRDLGFLGVGVLKRCVFGKIFVHPM